MEAILPHTFCSTKVLTDPFFIGVLVGAAPPVIPAVQPLSIGLGHGIAWLCRAIFTRRRKPPVPEAAGSDEPGRSPAA